MGSRQGLACIDGATQRSDDAMADAGLAGSGQLASGRFQWRTAYISALAECLPIEMASARQDVWLGR